MGQYVQNGAGIRAGSVDITTSFVLRSTTNNTEVTGKVAADMTITYWRHGGLSTAVTEANLAAVDSAHSDWGVKEIDAINRPGEYRLDLADAVAAFGADFVRVAIKVTGAYIVYLDFALTHDGWVRSFTPQALAAGSLTLDAGADAGDGAFLGKSFIVAFSDDATDLGAMFLCHTSYTGATKVALGTWTRVPTGTVATMVLVAIADGFVQVGASSTAHKAEMQQEGEDALAAFGAALEASLAALDAKVPNFVTNPPGFKKNTAITDFSWPMRDADGDLVTGLTVTGQIQKDGGAFAAVAGTIAEIGTTGMYQVTTSPALTATEMNADQVVLLFTATGAKPTVVQIYTEP